MSKPHWFKICNAVENPDEAEVLIYDEIGIFGVTAKDFVDELKATGAKQIHLRINSPGGEVFAGITIYNYLRSFKGSVRVTVDGAAISIASVIAMAGKKICMAENAMMMIHNPWGFFAGDSADARRQAELLDKIRDQIVKAYTRRTGQDADTINGWMDEEKWMDAVEAVELGFADEIDEEVEAKNFACFNLAKFKNAPVDMPSLTKMNLTEALAKISTLEASNAAQATVVTTLTTERDTARNELTAEKGKLTGKDSEISNLQSQGTAKDGEIATAKAALKTEQEAHAATKTKATSDLEAEKNSVKAKVDEELAKLGHRRIGTGAGAPAQMNRAEFDKLSPAAKGEFCKGGGKLIDG